jgi:hypothetical protein
MFAIPRMSLQAVSDDAFQKAPVQWQDPEKASSIRDAENMDSEFTFLIHKIVK